jgi:CRAL/TRIO domain
VWNIFKHFVDPHVKELIEIATEHDTEALLEKHMDLSVLPKEIAPDKGRGRAVQGYEPVWEGGPLPPPGSDDWKRGTPVFRGNATDNKGRFPEPEIDSNLVDTSQPHSKQIAPSTPLRQSCADAGAATEEVEVTLEKAPRTPIQPKTLDSFTSGSVSSTSDWEKLPTPAPRKKNIQQAWTVTPSPCCNLDEVWKKERVDGMAQLWQLNEMEKQHMDEFKDRIQDIQHWKNDPYELVRFYREYKGDLEKAEHSFRRMIVFRVENHMDKYLQQYGEPNPLFLYVPCAVLRGKDKDGDPIFVDRLGSCDWHSLLKHFGHDGVTNYLIFIRELNNCRQFWEPYEKEVLGGRRVRRYTVIIDLEGLHSGHARPSLLALLKRTSRISHYYSGWVKRILIVRAPPTFRLIWPLVKGYYATHLRDLIELSGRQCYLSMLDKYIDRTVLPSVICPEGNGEAMPGYYQHVNLDGGPIPKEVFQKALHTTMPRSSSCTPDSSTGIQTSSRRLLAPMPPGYEDDLDQPSSPVSTRHLLMGTWRDDAEASAGSKEAMLKEDDVQKCMTPKSNCQGGFASPMFTYYW